MDRDERLRRAWDPERFRSDGHALIDQLADHLAASLARPETPVYAARDPDALLAEVSTDYREPVPLAELLASVRSRAVHQHHPRCVGHQVAAPLPAAALADLQSSLLNNGMASYESGPISSVLERQLARWLTRALGWPTGADGFLTSGGTLGNLTALLAARQAKSSGDAWRDGSRERLCVIASEHAHYCVARAVQVMGWGAGGTVLVPMDAAYRMDASALPRAIASARANGRRPIAVVASAGASPTGNIDPLPAIADVCASEDLWLHVDGAHGASLCLSDRYRNRLAGIERADSVVWDAHKLMAVPGLITAVLFRDGACSFQAFSQEASYLFKGERPGWYDLGQRNLECTKRMMSVTLHSVLASLGPALLDDYVSRQVELAAAFAEMLEQSDDFDLTVAPDANIVCFRRRDTADQDALRDAVNDSGRFFLTRTTLAGEPHLRVTLMNPFTTQADLAELLAALRAA